MIAQEWTDVLMGVIMGLVTYIVVDILLDTFDLAGEEASQGAELIETLVPIAIAVAVVMYAFRGLLN